MYILFTFQADSGDYLQLFIGVGYGGYYAIYLSGEFDAYTWQYDAEFFQIFWHSNGLKDDIFATGFKADIRRVG